ncbi:uncharacterized protein LOC126835245 isoform X2 [Adelges cooleyi]|uniref:uncharacterized protein LOC126835245 isoform X2 n=1 Tax=Adelges cooleyi TaxID=133065 RepID=UPI00217F3516|nr:uncharacterized protein LOC126835245 isoform X2 [Adelges cooleyi]
MKLFWFLISCVFVNISTYDINDYKRDMAITNEHIKLASDMFIITDNFNECGLEHIIKNIIGNNNYSLDTPHLGDFEESVRDQTVLREKIQYELYIPVPEVPEQNYKTLTLIHLGDQRRKYTRPVLINIFHQVIVGFKEQFPSVWICRLIALFTSTKFPMSYVRDIHTGPNKCTTYDGFSLQTYRQIEGEWYHFVNNINFMKLEEEFVY